MKIGLLAGASTLDGVVQQAKQAEVDGFATLWFPGATLLDPLAAIVVAGQATSRIELGTSVLRTYEVHPGLQARRSIATAEAVGGRFTLGIGPSHESFADAIGISYAHAGRSTDEYVQIVATLLAGDAVNVRGDDWTLSDGPFRVPERVGFLVAALAPRLLRVAGQYTDGTILWMGNAQSIRSHVAPLITAAADAAGRSAPRIVAGLPVAVTDDEAAGRTTAAERFTVYGTLPNYRRLLDHGGVSGPGEAAIVGDEASVTAQIDELFAAGATDLWAAPFPVGDDREESVARTRALLKSLVSRPKDV